MAETCSPVPSPVRVRRSAAEAAALVADWRASGLSKEAFSRERGILRSALMSCIARVTATESAPPAGFVEVRPPSAIASGSLSLEIGSGLRLTGLDVPTAAALVMALTQVRR